GRAAHPERHRRRAAAPHPYRNPTLRSRVDQPARPDPTDWSAHPVTTTNPPTSPARLDSGLLRPGSRAARMAHPLMLQAIRQVAAEHGVCIRPIPMRHTNLATGQTTIIDLPCNATLDKKCPP